MAMLIFLAACDANVRMTIVGGKKADLVEEGALDNGFAEESKVAGWVPANFTVKDPEGVSQALKVCDSNDCATANCSAEVLPNDEGTFSLEGIAAGTEMYLCALATGSSNKDKNWSVIEGPFEVDATAPGLADQATVPADSLNQITASFSGADDANLYGYETMLCANSSCDSGCSEPVDVLVGASHSFENVSPGDHYVCSRGIDNAGNLFWHLDSTNSSAFYHVLTYSFYKSRHVARGHLHTPSDVTSLQPVMTVTPSIF